MGEPVTSARNIERCYQRGRFYYQFVRPGYLSRIMRCDNESECKWLSQQVDPKNPVMVRPM